MVAATKTEIGNALDWEITDWRETQRAALGKIAWPTLSGDADLFKTAAMCNFGVDATQSLFPSSAAATIITSAAKKFAVPLWILGQAQTAFQTLHQSVINRANKKLTNEFSNLRDDFIRQIQKLARNFKNEPYAREVTDTLFAAVSDVQFKDGAQRDVLLRQLIRDANLIETDPGVIRKRTNDGFGRLCTKIRDLWRASYHDPWFKDARMWFASSDALHMWKSGMVGQEWSLVRTKEDEDYVIRNAWRMRVQYINRPFSTRDSMDDCYVTLQNKTGKPVKLARTFKGAKVDPAALKTAVAKLKTAIRR